MGKNTETLNLSHSMCANLNFKKITAQTLQQAQLMQLFSYTETL